ncbi:MAG TPA: peptidase, partial [Polyangium sp.]|nr:peptidase [Polyangium sp.]
PEMEGGPDEYWDGGVIEISGANGNKWEDVSTYVDPGYGGTLYDQPENSLSPRKAFVGTNASWPEMDTVTLSFGKMLAGKQIKIRFRIGSDSYVGDYGWDVDDVSVQGIEGKPFPALVPSANVCNSAPNANAGENARTTSAAHTTLDASKSSDADGDTLTFAWTQVNGPTVELDGATNQTPTFIAPGLRNSTTLTFQVAVSDGIATSVDTVDVLVEAAPIVAGGGCSMVTSGKTPSMPLVFGAFLGLAALRRRNRRSNG